MPNVFLKNKTTALEFDVLLLLIFALYPFGAFIIALLAFNRKSSRIVYVLFWGLWGFSRFLIFGHDAVDWTFDFLLFSTMDFQEFKAVKILTFGVTSTDFVFDFYSFILSRFTNSTAIFWMIHGIGYAYLYTKCFPKHLKDSYKTTFWLFLLFIIFFFFIPRTAYGVRFWYAALLYIIAITQIILYERKKYQFLLYITPLVHFGFILAIIPYMYYTFIKRNNSTIWLWLIISIIIYLVGTAALSGLLNDLPVFERKLDSYGNIEQRASYYNEKSWLFMLDKYMYSSYSIFLVIFFWMNHNRFSITKKLMNLNYFLLLFIGLLFMSMSFLDVLDRFSILFTLITILYFIYLYTYNKNSRTMLYFTLLSIPFWGTHLLVNFLKSRSTVNPVLFYSPLWKILSGALDLPVIY